MSAFVRLALIIGAVLLLWAPLRRALRVGYLDTANRTLKSPRSGSYRVSATRITWSGGPLAQLYGVVKTSAKFEVWAKGEKFSSYWCYFKF